MISQRDGALVRPIERAVKDDRVTSLAGVLVALHSSGVLAQAGLFAPPLPDHYSRKLIWEDPGDRFVIVGMTWAVGQSSSLHDHAGLWGVEIVVDGTMRETTFRLVDQDTARGFRFVPENDRRIEKGGVGILIPPLEYHGFGNGGDTTAHTVHVYGGNLRTARAFSETADGWWKSRDVNLRYDA